MTDGSKSVDCIFHLKNNIFSYGVYKIEMHPQAQRNAQKGCSTVFIIKK